MKVLFVYPRFERHAQSHPELLEFVPMNEYLGSPSLGIASMAAMTPSRWQVEFRDDRLESADRPTDADLIALSVFTPAASRAIELARSFREQGKTVVAGGVFATALPDEMGRHVDAVVVGEGEASWVQLLADVERGALKPRYEPGAEVDLSTVPVPDLSHYFATETDTFRPDDYPLQISRGCALSCHACILPLSMTRKQRPFPMEYAMGQLEQLRAAGKRACLTEDASWFPYRGGRRHLSGFFQEVARSGVPARISYVGISMPMILATPMRYFDEARAAGVNMFYLVGGFDPITMKAFTGDDEVAWQRGLDAIAKVLDAGIDPYTSFLIGGDQDDLGTVDRMLEFAQKAGIRKAEFAIATPYPGTPQWQQLQAEGRILTVDWRRYNDANVVFQPAQMTVDQLTGSYIRLWKDFYADKGHLADLPRAARTIQF